MQPIRMNSMTSLPTRQISDYSESSIDGTSESLNTTLDSSFAFPHTPTSIEEETESSTLVDSPKPQLTEEEIIKNAFFEQKVFDEKWKQIREFDSVP